jgi:hypothetical protein
MVSYLSPGHLPSILHGALVGVGSLTVAFSLFFAEHDMCFQSKTWSTSAQIPNQVNMNILKIQYQYWAAMKFFFKSNFSTNWHV